jgi:hypothetical protein
MIRTTSWMVADSELSKARTRSDLLDDALSWIEANLVQFDPLKEDVRPDPLRNKALGELAFLCDCIRRARPEWWGRARHTLSFVADIWRQPAYQDLIARNPESLQLYVLTYNSLLHSGFEVADAARIIQRVVDAGYATAVEAVPFRLMDLRQVLDYAGLRHSLPDKNELFARTMLSQRPPLSYLTKADVYCLTHAIFYLTDFGFEPPAAIDPSDRPDFRETIEQLLGLYVRLQDWDLTSELLVCAHCLGSGPTVLQQAAWEALAAAQLEDGSVPAPKYDAQGAEARRSPGNYAFEHNYHTTLVAALAALLCPS